MSEDVVSSSGQERAAGPGRVRAARLPVRPGPGSFRLLGWLGRLGIAGVEPSALALGLSVTVAYSHLARLAREGLVVRVVVGDGGGGVFAITRAGARVAREHGAVGVVAPNSSSASTGRHARAISWVAASSELRGRRWLGPAELRAESGWRVARDDGARHAPDLGLVYDGKRVALEVELHAKAPARLQAILRGYRGLIDRGALTSVAYVVDRRDVSALVRRQADLALLGDSLRVGPLEGIVATARRDSAARRPSAAGSS